VFLTAATGIMAVLVIAAILALRVLVQVFRSESG
jgi:hypothetical protein